MRIGLHDDKTGFPNLALMKLSAWHKANGDKVSFYSPIMPFERVYSSKVFTFTLENPYLPANVIKGGSGYGLLHPLPEEIEHRCPDYSLYGLDYSLGFLTRGCIRRCPWCIAPVKEGSIRAHADIDEFLRHKNVVLLDNNVLAHPHGITQIEKMAKLGVKIDFNQGLDARLIDEGVARLFGRCKWLHPLRLACDHAGMMQDIGRAVQLLRWHNVTPRHYFCYCLVRDVPEAVERVRFLKGIDVDPFAQPYIDPAGNRPTHEQRAFARWVNHKAEFKSRTWEEYRAAHVPEKAEAV